MTSTDATRIHQPGAPRVRRALIPLGVLVLLASCAWWAWQQPFMAYPRTLWEISRMEAPSELPMPVAGIAVDQVADTWRAARGDDRRHEGVDIFAERGTPVRSTTRGIVSSTRERSIGGRQVWVVGPNLERHYYAHLDAWAEGLKGGDVIAAGDTIGFVGNTGNAQGTPAHLHYGIYGDGGVLDPLPRLRAAAARVALSEPEPPR